MTNVQINQPCTVSLFPSAYIGKPFKPNDVSAALEILSLKIQQKESLTYDIFLKKNLLSSESLTFREIEVLQSLVQNATNIEPVMHLSKNNQISYSEYFTKTEFQF